LKRLNGVIPVECLHPKIHCCQFLSVAFDRDVSGT
jgi:hypothetical protein